MNDKLQSEINEIKEKLQDDGTTEVQSIHFYHGGEAEEESEYIAPGKYRCPNCGAFLPSPKVDMCNNCGSEVDPFDAINPFRLEDKGEIDIKVVKHWKRGSMLDKDENIVHYDIFFGDRQFVCSDNPLEDEKVVCSERNPYKSNFIDEVDKKYIFIDSNSCGSIENSDSWMKTILSTNGKLYEGEDCFGLFYDDRTICVIEKEDTNNLWLAKDIDIEDCCFSESGLKLENKTEEHMSFSMNSSPIEVSSMTFEDDKVNVEGLIISKGSWNGVYFPKDVLKNVDEEILENMRIDVGTHSDKVEDAGEIINYEWNDEMEGWKYEVDITDDDAIERLEEMDSPGFSIEVKFFIDRERNIIEEISEIDCAVIVPNPACKVCYVD